MAVLHSDCRVDRSALVQLAVEQQQKGVAAELDEPPTQRVGHG